VTERLAIAVGSGFNALKVLCGNRWFCRPSRWSAFGRFAAVA